MDGEHYWRFAFALPQMADLVNNVRHSQTASRTHSFPTRSRMGALRLTSRRFSLEPKDRRWSVGYERLPRGATTLNGCVKVVCTPSRVYGTFYKVYFFYPFRDRGRGGESTERDVSRGGFDFRAATKIAKLFAVVHSQFCACAQKKSCRGPLGCSDAHTHRALPPAAAWAAARTPTLKRTKV